MAPDAPGIAQDRRDDVERISTAKAVHNIADGLTALAVPVINLVEAPSNPRRGDVEAIARSFRVFGQRKPLVARRTGSDEHGCPVGIVEAGNHGLKAARDVLAWTHVAAVFVDDDETTAAAYGLADNRTAELGDYDTDLLANELAKIAGDPELLAASAYDADDLARMLGDAELSTAPLGWDVYDLDDVVASALAYYRRVGMPVRALTTHECMQEVNQLAACDGVTLLNTRLGYATADTYHPHRFAARVAGRATILEVFERDEYLTHALRLLAAEGRPLNDSQLLSVLSIVRGAQVASNFRPGFALALYRRYAFDGATVLDTSTGYGGRLVGFLASTCGRYIGIDPNTETHNANVRMAADLGCSKLVELHNLPAEDVTEIEPASCDFAFTSPPYFAKERYADEATQSCVRYPTGDAWRDGFLRPTMALQYRSLKPGSVAAVNIADVKLGASTFPLVDWTIAAGEEAGFELLRRERFRLAARAPGSGKRPPAHEPVLVFGKP